MTRKELLDDLKAIRYYYARKDVFEAVESEMGENAIVEKVKKYNKVMRNAPIRVYDLYIELYLRNNTQESLADKWGFTPQYIRLLNMRLYEYLEKNLSE